MKKNYFVMPVIGGRGRRRYGVGRGSKNSIKRRTDIANRKHRRGKYATRPTWGALLGVLDTGPGLAILIVLTLAALAAWR